ncbi:unnamed protein product, partial [Ilex paraguariensis]
LSLFTVREQRREAAVPSPKFMAWSLPPPFLSLPHPLPLSLFSFFDGIIRESTQSKLLGIQTHHSEKSVGVSLTIHLFLVEGLQLEAGREVVAPKSKSSSKRVVSGCKEEVAAMQGLYQPDTEGSLSNQ